MKYFHLLAYFLSKGFGEKIRGQFGVSLSSVSLCFYLAHYVNPDSHLLIFVTQLFKLLYISHVARLHNNVPIVWSLSTSTKSFFINGKKSALVLAFSLFFYKLLWQTRVAIKRKEKKPFSICCHHFKQRSKNKRKINKIER